MGREWKPGDVAMVECSDGEWRRALFLIGGGAAGRWVFGDNTLRNAGISRARPLVVLDPSRLPGSRWWQRG